MSLVRSRLPPKDPTDAGPLQDEAAMTQGLNAQVALLAMALTLCVQGPAPVGVLGEECGGGMGEGSGRVELG